MGSYFALQWQVYDNFCPLLLVDMFSLSEYLAMSLGIRDKPASKLDEMTLKGIAKYLLSDQCHNVVTMAGAGISTCEYWSGVGNI